MKRSVVFLIAALLFVTAAASVFAVPTATIKVVGISAMQVAADQTHTYTKVTSGMPNVGVGEYVYLKANDGDTTITGYTWSLAAPNGSHAQLSSTDHQVVQLQPDMVGTFRVTLQVTSPAGQSAAVNVPVNSANYAGVGGIAGDAAAPQCAACHGQGADADKVTPWMGTKHAHRFEKGYTGVDGSHYSASCIRCHTVGYDTDSLAANGGFDDIARANHWTFQDSAHGGQRAWSFDSLKINYPAVANMTNIQCENCHGPGGSHMGNVQNNKMVVDYDVGNCNVCHDGSSHHYKGSMWRNSLHSHPVVETSSGCVKCHSAIGFVQDQAGVPDSLKNTAFMPITCAACHDPHDATNPNQLRTVAPVTLMNGVQTDFGKGNLCANCHHARVNASTYVIARAASHFGPHHGPQADMLAGTNAINFGKVMSSVNHANVVTDACVGCHMQADTMTAANPDWASAGNHSFSMVMKSGTDYTNKCRTCHNDINSFDSFPASGDWDGNGTQGTVHEEIAGLLNILGNMLPPDGPTVVPDTSYTLLQRQAAFNYTFVNEDKSQGMHNAFYARDILKAAIDTLSNVQSVEPANGTVPAHYALNEAYPNPFNPVTAFTFNLARAGRVDIRVYDMAGREIQTVALGERQAGSYKGYVNLMDRPSGVYFLRMIAGDFSASKKLVLVK